MKKEFPLADTWASFEIHPETPPGGVAIAELFPGRDMSAAGESLRRRAAEFGLPFVPSDWLSNSRAAIEAAEFARDAGLFEPFHRGILEAYFARGQDIGDPAVLSSVGVEVGLDQAALQVALAEQRYADRREAVAAEARRLGFSGVPTFVFAGRYPVVGAHPLDVFRDLLSRLRSAPTVSGAEMGHPQR